MQNFLMIPGTERPHFFLPALIYKNDQRISETEGVYSILFPLYSIYSHDIPVVQFHINPMQLIAHILRWAVGKLRFLASNWVTKTTMDIPTIITHLLTS